jgi:hypothetical protein
MLYQLPNGKTINISFEDFLELTDENIQYLVSINYGEVILSPFYKSSLTEKKQKKTPKDDDSIDYIPESDDVTTTTPIFISFDELPSELPASDDDDFE